jgi:hypothetical protein
MAEFIVLTRMGALRGCTEYYNVDNISSLSVVHTNNDKVLVKMTDREGPFWVTETLEEIMNAMGHVPNNMPVVVRRIRE